MLPLTDGELRLVTAGENVTGIVEEIRKALFHEHDSKTNVWKVYGASTVR